MTGGTSDLGIWGWGQDKCYLWPLFAWFEYSAGAKGKNMWALSHAQLWGKGGNRGGKA